MFNTITHACLSQLFRYVRHKIFWLSYKGRGLNYMTLDRCNYKWIMLIFHNYFRLSNYFSCCYPCLREVLIMSRYKNQLLGSDKTVFLTIAPFSHQGVLSSKPSISLLTLPCHTRHYVGVPSYTKKHRGGCTRGLLRPGHLITNRARSVRLVIGC